MNNIYRTRALKGFLLKSLMDIRTTINISIIIIVCSMLLGFILPIVMLHIPGGNISNNNSSMINTGYFIMLITFCIGMFISLSNQEIAKKFVFPINRRIFAVGNFILTLGGSLILLLIVCFVNTLEIFINKLLSRLFDNYIYINYLTTELFLSGFWLSLCYLVFIFSFVYAVSMIFHRYMIPTAVVIGLFLVLVIGFPPIRHVTTNVIKFYFYNYSLGLLSIKLLVSSVIFHIIGFIPLRQMEVLR